MESGEEQRIPEQPLGVNIRPLVNEDIPHLKSILDTWIKDRDTKELIPEEVAEIVMVMKGSIAGKNDRKYFVAEKVGGSVIGMVGMKPPTDLMKGFARTANPTELVNLYVALEEKGGKGVGTALVMRLEQEARSNGSTEVVLNSGPRFGESWGFYDRMPGYARIGIAEGLYGEDGDAPVWSKKL